MEGRSSKYWRPRVRTEAWRIALLVGVQGINQGNTYQNGTITDATGGWSTHIQDLGNIFRADGRPLLMRLAGGSSPSFLSIRNSSTEPGDVETMRVHGFGEGGLHR